VDAAAERRLEPVDQAGRGARPTGALAGAQALINALGRVGSKEGGPVGDEVEQQATLGNNVVAISEPTRRCLQPPNAAW
jgi:hypothetical protein